MNKKVIWFILIFITVITASVAYLVSNSTNNEQINDESNSTNTSQIAESPQPITSTTGSSGKYVEYSDRAIAENSGTKLLFFHASWCPQCRDLEADIENSTIPDGVTIIKVDYDSNQSLRQKYGVTLQTTIVSVDDDGNLIDKFVAYSEPTLDAVKVNFALE